MSVLGSMFPHGVRPSRNAEPEPPADRRLELGIGAVFAVLGMIVFRHHISGDASIYFTFIRNFVHVPYSFQPEAVSFGATSPLHVLLHAPVAALLGESFIPFSRMLNFVVLAGGVVALGRALGGTRSALLWVVALTLCALGGVYIGGGIVPALRDFALTSPLRRRFDERAELEDFIAAIPLFLIMDEYPGLQGAMSCLGEGA